DVRTGKMLRHLEGVPGGSFLAFSPDGGMLAVGDGVANGNEVNKAIHLFDVASGDKVRQMTASMKASVLAFAPDARSLAAWHIEPRTNFDKGKCALILWEIASGKERARLMELDREEWGSMAFSADGRLLASFGPDNTVCLWEVATGRKLHRFEG